MSNDNIKSENAEYNRMREYIMIKEYAFSDALKMHEIISPHHQRRIVIIAKNYLEEVISYLIEFVNMLGIPAKTSNIDVIFDDSNYKTYVRVMNSTCNREEYDRIFEAFKVFLSYKSEKILNNVERVEQLVETDGNKMLYYDKIPVSERIADIDFGDRPDLIRNYLTRNKSVLNNPYNQLTDHLRRYAYDFITENPPTDMLDTKQYFGLYEKANKGYLMEKESFYEFMRENGYNNDHKRKGMEFYYWSKNKKC